MECGKKAAMKLLLFITVYALGCHGNSDIIPKIGTLYPDDPHLVVGSTLVLNCTLQPPYNTTGLYFVANQTKVSDEYVHVMSERVAILRIPNVPAQQQTYYCKLPYTLDGVLFPAQRVQVSHVPGPVRNLSCVVDNWTSMNCNWSRGITDQFLVTNYSLAYTIDSSVLYKCPHATNFSCQWKAQDPRDFFQYGKVYYIKVLAKNKVGKSVVERNISTTTIIKPRPVKQLQVRDISSTSMKVSWISPSPYRFRPSTFRVSYQTADTQSPITIKTDSTLVELDSLQPFTTYRITVAAAPKPQFYIGSIIYYQNGFWSEDESTTVVTSSDVPSALPPFIPGAYQRQRITGKPDTIRVQIYWQRLSSRLANGIVKQYKIRMDRCENIIQRGGDYVEQVECVEEFTFIDARKKLLTHTFELRDDKIYSFWVLASSDKGFNDSLSKKAVVVVKPKALVPPQSVVAFQMHDDATASHIKVNWTQVEGATSYTVFWCYGKLTATCEEDVAWMKVPHDKHEANIYLDNRAYMFAVSAETTEGSTGMSAWTNSTYLYDAESIPVSGLKLSDHQDGESLTFEWTAPHSAQHVYVMFYVLSYCASMNAVCTGETKNITIPRYLEKYKLTNLEVDQQYKVVLYTVAPSGISAASKPLIGTAQPSGLRAGQIGGIVCGVILAAVLIFFGLYMIAKKICKGRQKFLSLGIEVPARINAPRKDMMSDKEILDIDEEENYENATSPTSTTDLFQNSADVRHYQENKENFRREGNLQRNGHLPNNNNSTLHDESLASMATLLSGLDSEDDNEDDVFHCDPKHKKHDVSNLDSVPEEKMPPGAAAAVAEKKAHPKRADANNDDEYQKFAMGNMASASSPVLDRIPGTDYLGINNNTFANRKYVQDLESLDNSFDDKSKMVAGLHFVADNENTAFSLNSNNSNSSSQILSKSGPQENSPPGVHYVNEGNPEYDSGFQCGYLGHSSETSPERVMPSSGQFECIELNSLDYAKIASDSDNDGSYSGHRNQVYSADKNTKPLFSVGDTSTIKNQDSLTVSVPQSTDESKTAKQNGYVVLPEMHDVPSAKTVQLNGYVTLPEALPSLPAGNEKTVPSLPTGNEKRAPSLPAGSEKREPVPVVSAVQQREKTPPRNDPSTTNLTSGQHRWSPTPTNSLQRHRSLPTRIFQRSSSPPGNGLHRQPSPLTSGSEKQPSSRTNVSRGQPNSPTDVSKGQLSGSRENSPVKSQPQKQSPQTDLTSSPYHQLSEMTESDSTGAGVPPQREHGVTARLPQPRSHPNQSLTSPTNPSQGEVTSASKAPGQSPVKQTNGISDRESVNQQHCHFPEQVTPNSHEMTSPKGTDSVLPSGGKSGTSPQSSEYHNIQDASCVSSSTPSASPLSSGHIDTHTSSQTPHSHTRVHDSSSLSGAVNKQTENELPTHSVDIPTDSKAESQAVNGHVDKNSSLKSADRQEDCETLSPVYCTEMNSVTASDSDREHDVSEGGVDVTRSLGTHHEMGPANPVMFQNGYVPLSSMT